jgi:hypothetical protein
MGLVGKATESILQWPALGVPAAATLIAAQQLNELHNELQDVTRKVRQLVSLRDEKELTTNLEAGSWSVAQVLDHLAQTTNAFLPAISTAISNAPNLKSNRALKTGALTQLLIKNLEPPYRLRFKALKAIVPRQHDLHAAFAGFEESQNRLAQVIQSNLGKAIDAVRIVSPVYARVSYNVYGALRMLAAHERRHLWQMEQILKALDARQHSNAS